MHLTNAFKEDIMHRCTACTQTNSGATSQVEKNHLSLFLSLSPISLASHAEPQVSHHIIARHP